MQQITLKRTILTPNSTGGELDVFGSKVHTLEDTRREVKVYGETCIPAGTYKLELRTEGGKNASYQKRFPEMHKGMIWLRNVPNFTWVYIHVGNTNEDTLGCILVGQSAGLDFVGQSVNAYKEIYPKIVAAIEAGGCEIVITEKET